MTYSEKLALAASFRAGTALEAGLPAENNYDKLKIRREAAHLPPWFKAVLPVEPPAEDLSHMNGKSWQKCQATGRKNGRRKKL